MDLEKALVNAELSTESTTLNEIKRNLQNIQNKIHQLEKQRNSNRIMQETHQAKLKQNIDLKEDKIERFVYNFIH